LFGEPATLAQPRVVTLAGQPIAYTLKRSARRRRIVLSVDETGLTVHVPWHAVERQIGEVIAQSQAWIARQLAAWADKKPRRRAWAPGEQLDFLGRQLTLALIRREGVPLARLREDAVLEVGLPTAPEPQSVREIVVKWYRRHALPHLSERVTHFCARLDTPAPRVFLSDARTRWGSCNAEREIRLNWRLMQAAGHVLDYVVAHEVAHLKVLSHSSRFWRVVERIYPGYQSAKAELAAMSHHFMSL
jgi:predicted metal-dependent hydrolase